MRLVVLESPYAPKGLRYGSTYQADLDKELAENLRYARLCMRDCLMRGEAPFASHMLYTQEGVLDDTKPEERKLGIEAGLAWAACRSDSLKMLDFGQEYDVMTVVYRDLGVSEGMGLGIQHALDHGRLIAHRTLPGWDGWKTPVDMKSTVWSSASRSEVEFKPVPKCADEGCDLPAVHCEHWHNRKRYWCEQHTPWSGHSLDQNCGPQCVALQIEVKRRLFG